MSSARPRGLGGEWDGGEEGRQIGHGWRSERKERQRRKRKTMDGIVLAPNSAREGEE